MTDGEGASNDHDAGAVMRSIVVVLPFLLFAACGPEDPERPDGGASANACGVAGAKTGSECAGLAQCGAGMQNFVDVEFCVHCFARADTHFCESGTCRLLDPGTATVISWAFAVPPSLKNAPAFTTASVNPIMADGTRVTCESLMKSSCDIDANPEINARTSRFDRMNPQGEVYQGMISADAGENRMVFIQITSEIQGKGDLLGWGCAATNVVKDMTNGPIEIPVVAL
jgi:hypothetical protein